MSDGADKSLLQQLADGDFKAAADSVEQAKRSSAGMATLKRQGEDDAASIKSLIQHYNKSLTVTNQYRIREFYKPSKVKAALQAITVSDDLAEIKAKLLANPDAVKAFYERYKDDYLSETISHILPKQGTKEFKQLAGHTEANSDDTLVMLKANESRERITGLLGSGKVKELEQALSTDKHRKLLLAELEALPTGRAYGLNTNEQDLTPAMQGVYELAEQIGIEPSGNVIVTVNYGDGVKRELRASHYNIRKLLAVTLARIKEQADSTAKSRARSNIKDGHDALPRPVTTTLSELFESSTFDTERLIRIYDDDIRTPEKLHEVGGYKLHATQQLLPLFKASNDYKTLQDLLKANIPQLEKVLITVLREAEKTGGLKDGDRWTKITALAEPMYKEQIAKRGKLDKVYREAYTNNLRMLDALKFFKYEKPSKSGGGIYTKFKFIEIKKLETNKAGNVVAVKWALHPEFIKIAHTLIYVNADKFLEIKSPNAQMLATYINDTFVMSDAQANRTIKGEPISRQASLLANKAGLSKSNITERYRYLTDSLNELEALGIIKWQAGNGGKQVKATDKSSQKVIIWPSKNTSGSHITRALNASNKQAEQAELTARQAELKKLVNIYRNDLKAAKDSTEYKKYLASDLGVEEQEIDLMLLKGTKTSKPQPITDSILKRIRGLVSDYDS